jgi:hypothetical protein
MGCAMFRVGTRSSIDGISDTPSRLLLIHMAQAWLRLADQSERNLTTDVVYETPVQRPAHEQQLQSEKKDGQCSPPAAPEIAPA